MERLLLDATVCHVEAHLLWTRRCRWPRRMLGMPQSASRYLPTDTPGPCSHSTPPDCGPQGEVGEFSRETPTNRGIRRGGRGRTDLEKEVSYTPNTEYSGRSGHNSKVGLLRSHSTTVCRTCDAGCVYLCVWLFTVGRGLVVAS